MYDIKIIWYYIWYHIVQGSRCTHYDPDSDTIIFYYDTIYNLNVLTTVSYFSLSPNLKGKCFHSSHFYYFNIFGVTIIWIIAIILLLFWLFWIAIMFIHQQSGECIFWIFDFDLHILHIFYIFCIFWYKLQMFIDVTYVL